MRFVLFTKTSIGVQEHRLTFEVPMKFNYHSLPAFVVISRIRKHYESCEMKHEMIQFMELVCSRHNFFCDHIWSCMSSSVNLNIRSIWLAS